MKNNLFCKATALVMGSLMLFSGQALASSSNNQEFTDADVLGNSESVIAQGEGEGVSVGVAVAIAVRALDRAVTVVRTVAINKDVPPEVRSIVLPKLAEAQKALARAESSAEKGDNADVARAVGIAISTLGQTTKAAAKADAGSAQAIAEAIAEAKGAQATAQGQASSQP